jgi:GNAT superfamily N-acetyltransferase
LPSPEAAAISEVLELKSIFRTFSLDSFLILVKELCNPNFVKLHIYEKSYFYHYWYTILNTHECYLLTSQGKDVAFVSKPQWTVKHWVRWPENLLLISNDFSEDLYFPKDFENITDFRTNISLPVIKNYTIKLQQSAYACNLKEFKIDSVRNRNKDIKYHILENSNLKELSELLAVKNRYGDTAPGFYEDYYIPRLIQNIKKNYKNNLGFGFYATLKSDERPVALAFYNAFEMPLTGTPCFLVDDIVVDKKFRRKRIATSLQAYAYNKLKDYGANWVLGNIVPDNASSLAQAISLGRNKWANSIYLQKKKIIHNDRHEKLIILK